MYIRKSHSGFTLIEIVVALVVIMVLAAVGARAAAIYLALSALCVGILPK